MTPRLFCPRTSRRLLLQLRERVHRLFSLLDSAKLIGKLLGENERVNRNAGAIRAHFAAASLLLGAAMWVLRE